mmetsp:Transcript_56905/g.133501  ORF Transcript_56905/g.133501 Transcript_56905/m.133501 type:complete len:335 (+) Transcript_56905:76-1080(+)
MGISLESSSTAACSSSPPAGAQSKARWADLSDEVEEESWPERGCDELKGAACQAEEEAMDPATDSQSVDSFDSSSQVRQQQDVSEAATHSVAQDSQCSKSDRPKTLLSAAYRAKGRGLRWTAKVADTSAGTSLEARSQPAKDQYPAQYYDRYYDLGYYSDAYYYGKGGRRRGWKDYEPASSYVGAYADEVSGSYAMKGKGMRQSQQDRSDRTQCKKQCQFIIGIEEDPIFRVGRRLLGPSGSHMKAIAAKTGCRLRLRGKGSWFLEGPNQEESSDPLMLCVSSPSEPDHAKAVQLIEELLLSVYADFRDFCVKEGWPVQDLQIRRNEGARRGAR